MVCRVYVAWYLGYLVCWGAGPQGIWKGQRITFSPWFSLSMYKELNSVLGSQGKHCTPGLSPLMM